MPLRSRPYPIVLVAHAIEVISEYFFWGVAASLGVLDTNSRLLRLPKGSNMCFWSLRKRRKVPKRNARALISLRVCILRNWTLKLKP